MACTPMSVRYRTKALARMLRLSLRHREIGVFLNYRLGLFRSIKKLALALERIPIAWQKWKGFRSVHEPV